MSHERLTTNKEACLLSHSVFAHTRPPDSLPARACCCASPLAQPPRASPSPRLSLFARLIVHSRPFSSPWASPRPLPPPPPRPRPPRPRPPQPRPPSPHRPRALLPGRPPHPRHPLPVPAARPRPRGCGLRCAPPARRCCASCPTKRSGAPCPTFSPCLGPKLGARRNSGK